MTRYRVAVEPLDGTDLPHVVEGTSETMLVVYSEQVLTIYTEPNGFGGWKHEEWIPWRRISYYQKWEAEA